jgi:hypothetical protein
MGLDSAILRFAFDEKHSHTKAGGVFTTALVISSVNIIIFSIILFAFLEIYEDKFFRIESFISLD